MEKLFTVVIPTFNEVNRLYYQLNNYGVIARFVILDNESTDGTREIAEMHGATVICSKNNGFPSQEQLQKAFNAATTDWILFTTCSEMMTPELICCISQIISEKSSKFDAILFYRRSITGGIDTHRYSYGAKTVGKWAIRLAKKKVFDLPRGVFHDETPVSCPRERIFVVPNSKKRYQLHYRNDDISATEVKHSRYGDIEALQRFKRGERFSYLRLLIGPVRAFAKMWWQNPNFVGFIVASLHAQLIFNIHLKLWAQEHGFVREELILRNDALKQITLEKINQATNSNIFNKL